MYIHRKCAFLFATILLLVTGESGYSQSLGRWLSRFDLGVQLDFIHLHDDESSLTAMMYGIYGGFNIPYAHLAENVSLDISPGLGISGLNDPSGFDDETLLLNFDMPILATIKFNTDASWKGNSGFGVGLAAGIGYREHYLLPTNGAEGFFWGTPVYMAEINFGSRLSFPGLIKIRYMNSLAGEYKKEFSSVPGDYVNVSTGTLYFIFTANY